jgi:prepilin-type N-terminal cleavage/methylation domain-containing protein
MRRRLQCAGALFRKRRAGMTLLEVLLTLAIFLVGSVGIMGLFVAASVLHKDAVDRRTAAYIGETLLAQVQAQPMHDLFAKTTFNAAPAGNNLPVAATNTGGFRTTGGAVIVNAGSALSPIANFGPPLPTWDGSYPEPIQFPILINSEQQWVTEITTANEFTLSAGTTQTEPAPVLQPLTWGLIYSGYSPPVPPVPGPYQAPTISVQAASGAGGIPGQGYLVIDQEWVRYTAYNAGVFTVYDDQNTAATVEGRGWGQTTPTAHNVGTPVTVAQPYPGYPGFYYTVQYYPVNATGAEAHVIVTVGYGPQTRFRVVEFEGVYTPSQY